MVKSSSARTQLNSFKLVFNALHHTLIDLYMASEFTNHTHLHPCSCKTSSLKSKRNYGISRKI